MTESQQRTYMREVVLIVPEFLQSFHNFGVYPEKETDYPDVLIDGTLGKSICLALE